jgi:PadR family transcriptional regulator, regulatory protein PadR
MAIGSDAENQRLWSDGATARQRHVTLLHREDLRNDSPLLLTIEISMARLEEIPCEKSKGAWCKATLDMLILKVLAPEAMRGYGIARRIEQISEGVFAVNPGSLLLPSAVSSAKAGSSRSGNPPRVAARRSSTLSPRGRKQLQSETGEWGRSGLLLIVAAHETVIARNVLAEKGFPYGFFHKLLV